jgi:PAS domain-containing protein
MSRRDEPHAPATLTPAVAAQLRAEAEAHIRAKQHAAPADITALSPEAIQAVLHDLRVYQVELEMQNEELRRTQIVLDDERARYFDLYELAPVGYCTLDGSGAIEQVNLTAASLFGAERGRTRRTADQPFHRCCRPGHLLSVPATSGRVERGTEPCAAHAAYRRQLVLGQSRHCVNATTSTSDVATPQLRMTLTDITDRTSVPRVTCARARNVIAACSTRWRRATASSRCCSTATTRRSTTGSWK